MTVLWWAQEGEVIIDEAVAAVGAAATLRGQQLFISQVLQDTTLNVGMTTQAGDDVEMCSQSFIADAARIDKITAYVGKVLLPTDNLYAYIYTDNAGVPLAAITGATSAAVAGGDIAVAPAAIEFGFTDADFFLKPGVRYHVVFKRDGATSDVNYFKVNYKGVASVVALEALSRYIAAAWVADINGYDLYHIVYGGSMATLSKDIRITGGDRDVESVKAFGYNEHLDERRAVVNEASFTLIHESKEAGVYGTGDPQAVGATAYYRIRGSEKAANDRTKKSICFSFYDGTNTVNVMMNDAQFTTREMSLAADGHMEETITAKCLASDYYEEDNF